MKKFLFPQIAPRMGFLIFSIVATSIMAICRLDAGVLVLAGTLLLPVYILYMNARIRDWGGKTLWWNVAYAALVLMAIVGTGQQDEAQAWFAMTVLFILHFVLLLKKGNSKSETLETVSSDIKDRLELRKLQKQKRRLERQKKIGDIKREIESQKN